MFQVYVSEVEMYTFHQQVCSDENLGVWIGEYGAVVAHAVLRTLVLYFYVFGKPVYQAELTQFRYFHYFVLSPIPLI